VEGCRHWMCDTGARPVAGRIRCFRIGGEVDFDIRGQSLGRGKRCGSQSEQRQLASLRNVTSFSRIFCPSST
jgi:hypothetical protein